MQEITKRERKLLDLQVAVSEARGKHEDLAKEHRLFVAQKLVTSAAHLKPKVDAALRELEKAQSKLLAFYRKHPTIGEQKA